MSAMRRLPMIGLVVSAAVLAFASRPARAADAPGYEPLRQDVPSSRLINLETAAPLARHTLELTFTHRFQEAFQDGSGHDLWGLDSGADVGIGFAYGLTDNLEAALYPSSVDETYEASAKFALFRQAAEVPISLALRAGVDSVGRQKVEDRTRPFLQILVAHQFAPGWNLLVAPSWVRDTPRLRNATNVPVGITCPFLGHSLLAFEFVPRNHDLHQSVDAWSVAWNKSVGQHVFELSLGNSRATTVDQILGGDFTGGFKSGDVRLGFNLVRKFAL